MGNAHLGFFIFTNMEMMKIRKGNDIRLKVQLKLNTPVLETRAVTPVGGAF